MFGDKVAAYQDGAETRYDMPSLLAVAVGYDFTPQLRAALEYHFFDDRHAKMAGDRQKTLEHGTNEFLAGIEYDINKKFTISCGGQSWSLGLGGAWNINEKARLNVSYFCSLYSNYNKTQANYQGTPYTGTEIYSRTNHVIGVGIDYKF